jgi:hypothetical protein
MTDIFMYQVGIPMVQTDEVVKLIEIEEHGAGLVVEK